MNQIIIFKNDFLSKKKIILFDRRYIHIRDILKLKKNDTLRIGLINQKQGKGIITKLNRDSVEIETNLSEDPPQPLPVALILALPRPKTLKKVFQYTAAMGVKKIILLRTWKVDKSYWQSPLLKIESINQQLILGLEQACDTILPVIIQKKLFKPFVLDELPELIKNTIPLIAHPTSNNKCPEKIQKNVTLAIGPEGGFTDYEIQSLESIGFSTLSIGKRILRVENAIPVILSKLF